MNVQGSNDGDRVPTVADRIAQEVARRYLEPILEPLFHVDSYGYRRGKSAIDAVHTAQQRCWRYDWVLDSMFSIRAGSCRRAITVPVPRPAGSQLLRLPLGSNRTALE
jgi:hypothetical protein